MFIHAIFALRSVVNPNNVVKPQVYGGINLGGKPRFSCIIEEHSHEGNNHQNLNPVELKGLTISKVHNDPPKYLKTGRNQGFAA